MINNINDIKFQKDKPVVFITGVTGQDGSHLVDYLLRETDLNILGGVRLLSVENHLNISHLKNEHRFKLVNFELTDSSSIYNIVRTIKPNYYINLAAQSFVHGSWDVARQTWMANSTSVLDALEAIRQCHPTCRFYNAGSSEEFGNVVYDPQDENHPPMPRSPYGASKCASRTLVKTYRESYGLYAVQGWLFNHEGTRRGEKFVTRKITKGVARIVKEINQNKEIVPIELGNINTQRDWSDAEDMVDAIWRMLNQENYNSVIYDEMWDDWWKMNEIQKSKWFSERIKEYVCSSNETHTIREFVILAFQYAGILGNWIGEEIDEKFVDSQNRVLVKINTDFYRPAEVEVLRGDSSKIRNELNWKPKTFFKELVKKMIERDLQD